MTALSKLCDAADWFRPEVEEIIVNELREVPRFHRKQWESAMIMLALRRQGKMHPGSYGLSMGGGKELVMYAVARQVGQLVVTDLYDTHTTWDCARTGDPDEYVKQHKPFPVDDARLKAFQMDMRDLRFDAQSFDFCYSTCAVEHIGEEADFVRHFNEVARVLKDDGVYIFTTEVSYENVTIRDDHNFVFSLERLNTLFAESDLQPDSSFDARLSAHKINSPTFSNLINLSYAVPEMLTRNLLQEFPHLHLMRGRHPFTCALFVMRKRRPASGNESMHFIGERESREFMECRVSELRRTVHDARVSLAPFSSMPGSASVFYADHAEFFNTPEEHPANDSETVFHTDYFWWGTGNRVFDIALDATGASEIEIRIHSYETLASHIITCDETRHLTFTGAARQLCRIEIATDDARNYAVLAKAKKGRCIFGEISIMSYPQSLVRNIASLDRGNPDANENTTC